MRRAIAFVLVLSQVSLAYPSTELSVPPRPDIGISTPFVKPTSLEAMQKYIARKSLDTGKEITVPDDFYRTAPLIKYWGYRFEPNDIGTYDIIFQQIFDATSINAGIIDYIGSLRDDGCSFYRTTRARISGMTSKRIEAAAEISGKQRACDNILGTHNIGDIGGSATVAMTFHTIAQEGNTLDSFRGAVVADKPVVNVDAKATSIFGLDLNSLGGQVVAWVIRVATASAVLIWDVGTLGHSPVTDSLNIFDSKFWRDPEFEMNGATFALQNDGRTNSKAYREFLNTISSAVWSVQSRFVIDDRLTGFGGSIAEPILVISFTARVKPDFLKYIENIEESFHREIALIKSFDESKSLITIRRGDSLWKLAEQKYGNPYLHYMLGSYNGMNRSRGENLVIGTALEVPPLHELVSQTGVHFMRPGETISEICRIQMTDYIACMREFRRLNTKVDLSKLRALEAVKVPASH